MSCEYTVRVGTPVQITVDVGQDLSSAIYPYIYLKTQTGENSGYTTKHSATISGETVYAVITPDENHVGKVLVVGEVTFSDRSTPSQSKCGGKITVNAKLEAS